MRTTLPACLLGVGLLITVPACAQTYRYGYGEPRSDIERRAYDRGFHEGTEDGRSDARKGRPADYRRHDEFRDADEGYNRSFGDKGFYREVFRRGYVAGYDQAYGVNRGGDYRREDGAPAYPPASVYPAYPAPPNGYPAAPSAGYYSPAAQNGYRDGLRAGQNDARHGDRFDPVRSRDYRDADHDYDRRFGDREQYKREYRAAFQQGYQEGYSGRR